MRACSAKPRYAPLVLTDTRSSITSISVPRITSVIPNRRHYYGGRRKYINVTLYYTIAVARADPQRVLGSFGDRSGKIKNIMKKVSFVPLAAEKQYWSSHPSPLLLCPSAIESITSSCNNYSPLVGCRSFILYFVFGEG